MSAALFLAKLALGVSIAQADAPMSKAECLEANQHMHDVLLADPEWGGHAKAHPEEAERSLVEGQELCEKPVEPDDAVVLRCIAKAKVKTDIHTCMRPAMKDLRLRVLLGSAGVVLTGMRTYQISREKALGSYLLFPPTPSQIPGTATILTQSLPEGPGRTILTDLSQPEIHCRYSFTPQADKGAPEAPGKGFTAKAECDLDGDGTPAIFIATESKVPERITPEGVY